MEDWQEVLCSKMRATLKEYGRNALDGACVIGPHDDCDHVSALPYVYAPTLVSDVLGSVDLRGNVDHKIARFFEDA
jgi:hypothetical protein